MMKFDNYSLKKAQPKIDHTKQIYNVQSSEVASLIGKNQYIPREQAILKFLKRVIPEDFKKIEKVERFNLFEDTRDYKPYGFPISLNVIAEK